MVRSVAWASAFAAAVSRAWSTIRVPPWRSRPSLGDWVRAMKRDASSTSTARTARTAVVRVKGFLLRTPGAFRRGAPAVTWDGTGDRPSPEAPAHRGVRHGPVSAPRRGRRPPGPCHGLPARARPCRAGARRAPEGARRGARRGLPRPSCAVVRRAGAVRRPSGAVRRAAGTVPRPSGAVRRAAGTVRRAGRRRRSAGHAWCVGTRWPRPVRTRMPAPSHRRRSPPWPRGAPARGPRRARRVRSTATRTAGTRGARMNRPLSSRPSALAVGEAVPSAHCATDRPGRPPNHRSAVGGK